MEMCLLVDITPKPCHCCDGAEGHSDLDQIISSWEEKKTLTKVWVGLEEN